MEHLDSRKGVRLALRLALLVLLLCLVVVAQYLGGRLAGQVIHVLAVALIVSGPGLVAFLLARVVLPARFKDRISRSPGMAFVSGLGVILLGSGLAALLLHLGGKLVPVLKALSLL